MRLLIVAGGGGHFSSALSVIERLPKNIDVLVVGRKHPFEGDSSLSYEYHTCRTLRIPFRPLSTGRLQRKITKYTLVSLIKIPIGIMDSFRILTTYKPDVILSFGGYVSIPIVSVGYLLRIPLVIHEQTLEGGLSNRFASWFVYRTCISWETSRKFFPQKKTILTGLPLRSSILNPPQSAQAIDRLNEAFWESTTPLIYINGGSSGSHAINLLLETCLPTLLRDYRVIHQTGDSSYYDFDRLVSLRESLPSVLKERYAPLKFIEPSLLGFILKNTNLMVGRSGINTMGELLYWGVPALCIPLPYGQQNEQHKNAEYLKKLGIAEILNQKDAIKTTLIPQIERIIKRYSLYKKNALGKKVFIIKDAPQRIINVVYDVYESSRKTKVQ